MKINVLVDSIEYVTGNCYQHQVINTLASNFEVRLITMPEILSGYTVDKSPVISCLKLRTLDRSLEHLKRCLNENPVIVYEQDPWESFKDDSPYKGSYHRIAKSLNVKTFLNTSSWWSSHVRSNNLPSRFVRMGVLSSYCEHTAWQKKDIEVGFCGQIHPYRKKFFDHLSNNGINVKILPTSGYSGYLKTLSRIKIFAHCEKVDWVVEGEKIPANAMWIKDIEACARGCISIRDYEPEYNAYGSAEDIPAKIGFQDFDHSVKTIKRLLEERSDTVDTVTYRSVEYIRENFNWLDIVTAIRESHV